MMQRIISWTSGWKIARGFAWVLLLGVVGITIAEISSYTGVNQFYGTSLTLNWTGGEPDHHYRISVTEQDLTTTPPQQLMSDYYSQTPSVEVPVVPGRQYYATVQVVSAAGDTSPVSDKSVTYLCLGSGSGPAELNVEVALPTKTALGGVFPNPFNAHATIPFDIASMNGLPVDVSLIIYNVQGRSVRNLVHETRSPGQYREIWDGYNDQGSTVAAGAYICRLQVGTITENRMVIFMK